MRVCLVNFIIFSLDSSLNNPPTPTRVLTSPTQIPTSPTQVPTSPVTQLRKYDSEESLFSSGLFIY